MSRSTQYIGLTCKAAQFLKEINAEKLPSEKHTTGMFDEEVELGTWLAPDGRKYQEVVQWVFWSSGPMIFTALEITAQNGAKLGSAFQWVANPQIEGEYNSGTGEYWV